MKRKLKEKLEALLARQRMAFAEYQKQAREEHMWPCSNDALIDRIDQIVGRHLFFRYRGNDIVRAVRAYLEPPDHHYGIKKDPEIQEGEKREIKLLGRINFEKIWKNAAKNYAPLFRKEEERKKEVIREYQRLCRKKGLHLHELEGGVGLVRDCWGYALEQDEGNPKVNAEELAKKLREGYDLVIQYRKRERQAKNKGFIKEYQEHLADKPEVPGRAYKLALKAWEKRVN